MYGTLRIASLFCLLVAGLCFSAGAAHAQPQLPPVDGREDIPLPVDFSQVEFYLLTVGPGNHVWDNFGHSALRIVDHDSNTDLVLNWGLFDTRGGFAPFAYRFMQGVMRYELGVTPAAWELSRYQREQRTVWQDRINLDDAQKQLLYQRVAWNLREENTTYDYDYFDDNCTTRIRDYLDEALGGAIYRESRARVSDTYRDVVWAHYRSLPPVALALDILLNARVDRQMTVWEQMFLPLELRDRLLSLPAPAAENGALLSGSETLMAFEPPPPLGNPYHYFAALLLPLAFLLCLVRGVPMASMSSEPGYRLVGGGLSYRLLGLVALLLSLFSGLMGSTMSFAWLASGHMDLHANVNLLLFWPTDLLGAVFALRWLIAGRAVQIGSGAYQVISYYLMAHGLAALLYLALGLTGLSGQRIGPLMMYVLPVLLLFALLTLLAGFRPVRQMRFS